MAEFSADGDSESDIMVTSFSNPNYGLGLRGNPYCGVMAEGGSGVGDPNGNLSMSGGYDASSMSIDDSGDSAISSPVTDSDLTSPGTEEDGGMASGRHDDICDRMKRAVRLHLLDEMKQSASEAVAMTTDANSDSVNHSDASSSSVDTGLGTISESHTEQSPGTETGITNGTASLPSDGLVEPAASLVLPPGWQRHEDEGGAYYWHIKSGTIQREIPVASPTEQQIQHNKDLSAADKTQSSARDGSSAAVKQDQTSGGSETPDTGVDYETLAPDTGTFPIRFAVRSLGWMPIAEDQLTQENSSRAVNHCIVSLSSGARDINDVVGKWGDGKYLYMDLDQENLSLIDPHDLTVLNVQPIRSIRVWGVGRDNGRDFAYVARDRVSRRHMCHVFRCELPARHIANTLCEICKKLIAQRNAAQAGNTGGAAGGQRSRPTDLPNLHRTAGTSIDQNIKFETLLKNASFPTPMDEPRKVMSCHFLGTIPVSMATGIEVLNGAIETMHSRVPAENWTYVNVTVAPSTVTISDYKNGDSVLAECRVRFLSFLGISLTNVKLCAFIMHTAQDQFVAYVFYCEPSAGALSKTIEAACKLRYQKCLDKTTPSTFDGLTSPQQSCGGTTKGLRTNIKEGVQTVINSITKLRRPSKS